MHQEPHPASPAQPGSAALCKLDPLAPALGALVTAGLLLIWLVYASPDGQVATVERFRRLGARCDRARASALFTGGAWRRGGDELFSALCASGGRARVYAQSRLARSQGFVMLERGSVLAGPDHLDRWPRHYLRLTRADGEDRWVICSVEQERPHPAASDLPLAEQRQPAETAAAPSAVGTATGGRTDRAETKEHDDDAVLPAAEVLSPPSQDQPDRSRPAAAPGDHP